MNQGRGNEITIEVPKDKNPVFQVTKTSKYLALLLFIILPFMGVWLGHKAAPERIIVVEQIVFKESKNEVSKTENVKKEIDQPINSITDLFGHWFYWVRVLAEFESGLVIDWGAHDKADSGNISFYEYDSDTINSLGFNYDGFGHITTLAEGGIRIAAFGENEYNKPDEGSIHAGNRVVEYIVTENSTSSNEVLVLNSGESFCKNDAVMGCEFDYKIVTTTQNGTTITEYVFGVYAEDSREKLSEIKFFSSPETSLTIVEN